MALMEAMDSNGDGRIDYREFMEFLINGGEADKPMSSHLASPSRKRVGGTRLRGKWYEAIGELAEFIREHLNEVHPEHEVPLWQILHHLFTEHDPTDKGFIERDQFMQMLGALGLELQDDYAEALLGALDQNGDGNLDYKEFLTFVMHGADAGEKKAMWYEAIGELASLIRHEMHLEHPGTGMPRWQMLRRLFEKSDSDGSGMVNKREFSEMLDMMGLELSPKDARALLEALDSNGDGQLSYAEFLQFITAESTTPRGAGSPRKGGLNTSRSSRHEKEDAAQAVIALSPSSKAAREGGPRLGRSSARASGEWDGSSSFATKPALERAKARILRLCADKSPRQLRQLFAAHDRAGNGTIAVQQFRNSLDSLGGYPLEREEHLAVLSRFCTTATPDGARRLRYAQLVEFIFGNGVRRGRALKMPSRDATADGQEEVYDAIMRIRDAAKSTRSTDLYGAFRRLDRNGDGVLSRLEFQRGLAKLGGSVLSERELDGVMSYFDRDGDGRVSFLEFLYALVDWEHLHDLPIRKLERYFERLDISGTGQVDRQEFSEGIEQYPEVELLPWELDTIMSRYIQSVLLS
jgi:Ca2+-binding EF-hand superfamily protein